MGPGMGRGESAGMAILPEGRGEVVRGSKGGSISFFMVSPRVAAGGGWGDQARGAELPEPPFVL